MEIRGKLIINLRYADNTVLKTETEKGFQNLLNIVKFQIERKRAPDLIVKITEMVVITELTITKVKQRQLYFKQTCVPGYCLRRRGSSVGTPGEEAPGSIPAVATCSPLVRSVSV